MQQGNPKTRQKVRPFHAIVATLLALSLALMAFDAKVLAPAFADEGVEVEQVDQAQGGADDEAAGGLAEEGVVEPEAGDQQAQPEREQTQPAEEESEGARAGPDGVKEESGREGAETQAEAAESEREELVYATVTFFSDAAGRNPSILERRLVSAEAGQAAIVDVSGVRAEAPTSDLVFAGWLYAGGVQTDQIAIDPRDGDVELYPSFDAGHWLRFDAAAAEAVRVASRFVTADEGEISQLETTTRAGYSFDGWHLADFSGGQDGLGERMTDEAGAVVDPARLRGLLSAGDVTLTAKWAAGQTTYRVAIWHQNPDDDRYSFEGYDIVGDEEGERAVSGEMTSYDRAADVPGFRSKDVVQAPIAGDGSTVIALYYDRIEYEVRFHQEREEGSAVFDELTIKARYGADIHAKWPDPPAGETRYTSAWYTLPDESSNVFVTGIGTMPLGGADYYVKTDKGKNFAVEFMVQSVEGGNEFELYESQKFTSELSPTTTADDYKPIQGFAVNAASGEDALAIQAIAAGDKGAVHDSRYFASAKVGTRFEDVEPIVGEDGVERYTLTFYYLRLSYDIVFDERGGPDVQDALGIPYEGPLADARPGNYEEGETRFTGADGVTYQFEGWYPDSSFESPRFDFEGASMPASNLVLYAKWEPADYLVQIDPAGGEFTDSAQSTHFRVQHGETVGVIGVKRNYVADPAGEFVYDYETASGDTDDFGKALYVMAEEGQEGERYRYSENAYSLYGWFYAQDASRAPGDPFDFDVPIVQDTSIVARWRAAGVYDLAYNAVAVQGSDTVSGTIDWMRDEGYADLSPTYIMHAPEDITSSSGSEYAFVGWQVVSGFEEGAEVLEDTLYAQGDGFVVDSELARDNTIHLQAVYELVDSPTPGVPDTPGTPTASDPPTGSVLPASHLPQTGDALANAIPFAVTGIALAALALALIMRAVRGGRSNVGRQRR